MSFGRKAGAEVFSYAVAYRHRTWNHICWSYDGSKRLISFYFNGEKVGEKQAEIKYILKGAPYYENYLLLGQEPDAWKVNDMIDRVKLKKNLSRTVCDILGCWRYWNYSSSDNIYLIPEKKIQKRRQPAFRSEFLHRFSPLCGVSRTLCFTANKQYTWFFLEGGKISQIWILFARFFPSKLLIPPQGIEAI